MVGKLRTILPANVFAILCSGGVYFATRSFVYLFVAGCLFGIPAYICNCCLPNRVSFDVSPSHSVDDPAISVSQFCFRCCLFADQAKQGLEGVRIRGEVWMGGG